jgi:hypothetical protein
MRPCHVEGMGLMRRDYRSAISLPVCVAATQAQRAWRQCQRYLHRMMGMEIGRLTRATDPQASAIPQQDAPGAG